jgi:nucleotide-binding universal stress UspA family protein
MKALICYDGSLDAQAAIDGAARVLAGGEVTVLVIWETLLETMTRTSAMSMSYGLIGPSEDDGTDTTLKQNAYDLAADGARRATAAGLSAHPRIADQRESVAAEILAVAEEESSDVVVLGTRGRGGIRSLVLGSVSTALLHHAGCPVLVIPSPSLIEARRKWAEPAQLVPGPTPESDNGTDRHGSHSR